MAERSLAIRKPIIPRVYFEKRKAKEGSRYYLKFQNPLTGMYESRALGGNRQYAMHIKRAYEQSIMEYGLNGRFILPEQRLIRSQDVVTLELLWERFVANKEGRVKARTLECYAYGLKIFRRTFPGIISVAQVTDEVAEQYVMIIAGKVRPATVNRELRHLRGLWSVAYKKGLAERNVFAAVEKLKEPPSQIRTITYREEELLLRSVDGNKFLSEVNRLRQKAIIKVAVQAGLRSCELRHLRWQDIDLCTGEIRLVCRED